MIVANLVDFVKNGLVQECSVWVPSAMFEFDCYLSAWLLFMPWNVDLETRSKRNLGAKCWQIKYKNIRVNVRATVRARVRVRA